MPHDDATVTEDQIMDMNPDPKKVEELFDRAADLAREDRLAFLAESCGEDFVLRKRVV